MTFPHPEKRTVIPLWRQIQKNNFTRLEPLLDFLQIDVAKREQIAARPAFILNLPQRLAAKMEKNNINDPLFRQFVPLTEEGNQTVGFLPDPVQDRHFQKTKKILQKYHGRALIVASSACAMHCRYCFRQNFPYETEEKGFEEELAYLARDPSLSEVILSGGDPLSLSDGSLSQLFRGLNAISHIKRIRFHTRFPIGIPERIDPSFLDLLASSTQQIIFVVHVNHARELDLDVTEALKKIQALAIPVLNQSVLLRGVNDQPETLLDLSHALLNSGIIPYYLHCLDPVQGAAHFAVSEEEGRQLIRYLQEHLSGFGVPRLAREEPGLSSKRFLTD